MSVIHVSGDSWFFWCPGCDKPHAVSDLWERVGADGLPTIRPSVLVHSHKTLINDELKGDALTAPENITVTPQCHSFVTSGQIEYLSDSTHHLSGQTVPLPEWPIGKDPDHD